MIKLGKNTKKKFSRVEFSTIVSKRNPYKLAIEQYGYDLFPMWPESKSEEAKNSESESTDTYTAFSSNPEPE
jgi:hypothetical protein